MSSLLTSLLFVAALLSARPAGLCHRRNGFERVSFSRAIGVGTPLTHSTSNGSCFVHWTPPYRRLSIHDIAVYHAEVTPTPSNGPLTFLREQTRQVKRWRENWDEFAWPLFSKLGRLRPGSGGSNSASRSGDGSSSGGGCGCGAGGGAGAGSGVDGGRGRLAGGIFSEAGGWSASVLAESVVVPAVVLLILLVSVPWLSHALESWAVEWSAVVDRWRRR